MKKVLVVLTVLLCALTAFAAKNSVSVSVVPYGFQFATSSIEGQDVVKSTFGIGAEVSYKRFLVKGLYVEAGADWDIFKLKDKDPAYMNNLLAYAGVGYKCNFAGNFFADVNVDIATDTLLYDKSASETITAKCGAGLGYDFCDCMSAFVKCNGTFGFAKKGEATYINYRVLPVVGVSVNF